MKCEKPMRGDAARLKRARRRLVESRERAAKHAAKIRDHYACRCCGGAMLQGSLLRHVEAAHLVGKAMGGDHGTRSHHQRDYVTLCYACHQGPRSVHSAHIRLVFDPVLMGDGPVEFVTVVPGTHTEAPRVETIEGVGGAAVPNSTRELAEISVGEHSRKVAEDASSRLQSSAGVCRMEGNKRNAPGLENPTRP